MEIPGYRIIREIGQGGMATVYLALQEALDRHVALKVMSPALAADPSFGERFLKEARIVARLNHPDIVSIYDIGASGHYHYMAVEYLEGGNLKARIRRGMTPEEAVDILRQLAVPLGYAHQEGFVHRDIKPENVLFRKDGTPVLTDFGIAKAFGSKTAMAKTGTSIGTPHYMSPEQARGQGGDGGCDLYSLGVVFYEMLTGALPYDAEDTFAVALMHVSDPLPALPPELDRYQPLIKGLMAKAPKGRFTDVQTMLEAVENLQSGSFKNRPAVKTRVIDTPQSPHEENQTVSGLHIGAGVKWLGGGALAALLIIIVLLSWQGLSARFGATFFERNTFEQAVADAEAEQRAMERAEAERIAREQAEAERIAREREEAERRAREAAEAYKRQAYNRHMTAGRLAIENRNRKKAIEAFESALSIYPASRSAREGLERSLNIPEKPFHGGTITNALGMKFVYIEPGTFMMGSPSYEHGRIYNETQRQVTLTRGYYMQTTPVTQGQWKAVMGSNPSYFSKCGDNCPVERVSWNDAQEFIRKLNRRAGIDRYRLPTEAEWENAARAGSTTAYFFGNRSSDLSHYAWYSDNSGSSTRPVGQKPANAWGLYDMHGNVWEWVADWYGSYPSSAVTNPTGPSYGTYQVLRGGSWSSLSTNCRSASRLFSSPQGRGSNHGFRLVLLTGH